MAAKSISLRAGMAALVAFAPAAAHAYIGVADAAGFAHGFAHPLSGLDHILAMAGAGAFAARLGGRARWAVPLTFMALMVAGGALGIAGAALPFVEGGIALSVVALGLLVALRFELPVVAAMALVGIFAIFYGHAHGAEMPVGAAGAEYALGFLTATGLLHLLGLGIRLGIEAAGPHCSRRITQATGFAVAAIGVALLSASV